MPCCPPWRSTRAVWTQRFNAEHRQRAFRLEPSVSLGDKTASPVHAFWTHKRQINDGKNDRFVVEGNTGALPMGHFDGSKLKLWALAQRYTLADRFFQPAYGGSFLNHMWLTCACTPVFPNAPKSIVAQNERGTGHKTGEGSGSDAGRLRRQHHARTAAVRPDQEADLLAPPQTMATIGDRLNAKGISWVYYADGYDIAVASTKSGKKTDDFSYHHQPFTYFKRFIDSPQQRATLCTTAPT